MAKHHLKFFLKKYDGSTGRIYKSRQDYETIYWKGIGQARHRLNDYDDIRITKLMIQDNRRDYLAKRRNAHHAAGMKKYNSTFF